MLNIMSIEAVINDIRDILRKEGIVNMDSINHCILFVVARWLTIEKCKKLNIPEIYSFEKIMEKCPRFKNWILNLVENCKNS